MNLRGTSHLGKNLFSYGPIRLVRINKFLITDTLSLELEVNLKDLDPII